MFPRPGLDDAAALAGLQRTFAREAEEIARSAAVLAHEAGSAGVLEAVTLGFDERALTSDHSEGEGGSESVDLRDGECLPGQGPDFDREMPDVLTLDQSVDGSVSIHVTVRTDGDERRLLGVLPEMKPPRLRTDVVQVEDGAAMRRVKPADLLLDVVVDDDQLQGFVTRPGVHRRDDVDVLSH